MLCADAVALFGVQHAVVPSGGADAHHPSLAQAIDASPAVAVDALDRVTLDLDADEIATVAYILLDLGTCDARVARAGHLPPLLVTPTGR